METNELHRDVIYNWNHLSKVALTKLVDASSPPKNVFGNPQVKCPWSSGGKIQLPIKETSSGQTFPWCMLLLIIQYRRQYLI